MKTTQIGKGDNQCKFWRGKASLATLDNHVRRSRWKHGYPGRWYVNTLLITRFLSLKLVTTFLTAVSFISGKREKRIDTLARAKQAPPEFSEDRLVCWQPKWK